jgi:hypothetical protein
MELLVVVLRPPMSGVWLRSFTLLNETTHSTTHSTARHTAQPDTQHSTTQRRLKARVTICGGVRNDGERGSQVPVWVRYGEFVVDCKTRSVMSRND